MKPKNEILKAWEQTPDPALAYIRERGYCSFNSLKMVRDNEDPAERSSNKDYFIFGTELHARFLENKKIENLDPDEEALIKVMLKSLKAHAVVKKLLAKAKTEVEFKTKVQGVTVFGYIDILTFAVADLKTTRHTTMKQFVKSMDFLQAALYLEVTKLKDFYYIGISKQSPDKVIVFNVNEYPAELKAKQKELKTLLQFIKKNL